MSIHPVPTLGPAAVPALGDARVQESVPVATQTDAADPDLAKKSRIENPTLEPSMDSLPMRQDEVQVQRVNGASGDIVIRYLDASGHLILQIPSSQVLGLARAVEQALEEQANHRTGNTLPKQGEAFDGH